LTGGNRQDEYRRGRQTPAADNSAPGIRNPHHVRPPSNGRRAHWPMQQPVSAPCIDDRSRC
jgi:hypothetical protein